MIMRKQTKRDGENGSATVEAIISFTGFLFVIFTILNVINFCRAQMLISNAVDAAAKEISQYSYFYKMSGLQKISEEVSGIAETGKLNLNDIIGTVDDLYTSIGTAVDHTTENVTAVTNKVESGTADADSFQTVLTDLDVDGSNIETSINSVLNALSKVQNDPLLYMRSIVAVAGNEALDLLKSHVIAAPLAKMFTAKHFGETTTEASAALSALGVVGGLEDMNFNMSTVFSLDEPNNVHIVVYYKLRIVQVFNWITLEVPMCKEAVAGAWLGGDDVQEKVTAAVKTSTDQPAATEETAPEETSEVEETGAEEQEKVNVEGSYWYYTVDAHGYDNQAAAFDELLVDSYGIDREELVMNGLIYGRDSYNRAYGMTYCVDANEASSIGVSAYVMAMESLQFFEEEYKNSGGTKGYEPGSTIEYIYVVYVPENISDDTLQEIQKQANENKSDYLAYAREEYGINVPVSIQYVKAGGNYDYSGGGGNE